MTAYQISYINQAFIKSQYEVSKYFKLKFLANYFKLKFNFCFIGKNILVSLRISILMNIKPKFFNP